MNLIEYQAGLPKEVSKEDLITSLDFVTSVNNSLLERKDSLLKAIRKASTRMDLFKVIDRRFKLSLKDLPFNFYIKNAKTSIGNMAALRARVEKLPDSSITKTATLDVLSTIALVDAYQEVANWLLSYVHESIRASYLSNLKENEDLETELAPQRSVIRMLNENSGKAIWAMRVTAVKSDEFNKSFSEENALFVTPSGEAELKASGRLKGNPLNDPTAAGFNGNPFYAIGSYGASWVAHSHNLASEELAQLELMLSEHEREGKGNPQTERQIVILNQRIADKRALIKDLEN